jgi:hypothetical protein
LNLQGWFACDFPHFSKLEDRNEGVLKDLAGNGLTGSVAMAFMGAIVLHLFLGRAASQPDTQALIDIRGRGLCSACSAMLCTLLICSVLGSVLLCSAGRL